MKIPTVEDFKNIPKLLNQKEVAAILGFSTPGLTSHGSRGR